MNPIPLSEAILDGGVQSVNFFNGRLLSGEDLTQERTANRTVDRRLGQAVGAGIAFGLAVTEALGVSTKSAPVVSVAAGLAVNVQGQTLALPVPTNVTLTRADDTAPATPGTFNVCLPPQGGTLVAGTGVYLLVLSPASGGIGRAPVNGLDCCDATCNTRYMVEGVQFRLIQLPLTLQELQRGDLLRNHVAYKFFGPADAGYKQAIQNPFATGTREYGLLKTLQSVTDCDVPLAVFSWTTGGGIEYIDRWSVRRRITHRAATNAWNLLIGERRTSEAEAMFLQFQDQANELSLRPSPGNVRVETNFETLPPLGLLPARSAAVPTGFDLQTFFGDRASQDVAMLDSHQLRALAHEAVYHEPIDVASMERVQLYLVWESVLDQEAGGTTPMAAVFANRTLPYRGTARFGQRTRTGRPFARFGLSRFAPRVI